MRQSWDYLTLTLELCYKPVSFESWLVLIFESIPVELQPAQAVMCVTEVVAACAAAQRPPAERAAGCTVRHDT